MSLWTKLVTAATGGEHSEPKQQKGDTCPRCASEQLMSVPTDDNYRRAVLCLNCGWNSERGLQIRS